MKTRILISIICLATQLAIAQKKPVYINGYCNDSTINFVDIVRSEFFWWAHLKNERVVSSEKDANNYFALSFDMHKSSMLYFNVRFSSSKMYVTPGDSITFRINEENGKQKLRFNGKNEAHYNFFAELDELFPYKNRPKYKGNLRSYDSAVQDWYNKKKDFLAQYKAKHTMAKEVIFLANADIDYEQIFWLYMPIRDKKINQSELPDWYRKKLDQYKFQDDALLGSSMFHSVLILKNVWCYTDDLWQNFDAIWNNANINFKGRIKEYLLTSVISIYAKEQRDEYRTSLMKAINESKKIVKDSAFIKEVAESEQKYTMLNRPLPDSVINFTFLKEMGSDKRLTLGDVLKKQKGKALYFDLWASWCVPCRSDIKESGDAKAFFQTAGVTEIYISVDKDEEKWKRASAQDSITTNQYLLEGGMHSPWGKYFRMEYIPRYVLMDKNQLLKDAEAPRPNKDQLSELKKRVGEMNNTVVKYH